MSDNDSFDVSRRTALGGLAGLFGLGAVGVPTTGRGLQQDGSTSEYGYSVRATQQEGTPVNWVLPGPRRISEEVFGTPENPLRGDQAIQRAKQRNPGMADLLDRFPFPVGLPTEMRQTSGDGSAYTVTSVPTPFSDDHRPVDGHIDITYMDRSPWAGFRQGRDQVELDVQFTDPAGNTYTVDVTQLDRRSKNHAGGVLVGGLIHGTIGIGSPLFPKVYNYGAFWGIGTIDLNDGEQTWENQVIHFMTTQMARDHNYALAVDENMPLAEPFLGANHHTHGFIFPVQMTREGPQFRPLNVPFPPDRDQGQPFIHIMYDLDEVSYSVGEMDGGG